MATTKQTQAARKNLDKARQTQRSKATGQRSQAHGSPGTSKGHVLSAAEKDDLADSQFAFPKERKEPLTDPSHVRNAVARFDQVEGVTDAERTAAWKRIKAAARRFEVDIEADDWRELLPAHKAKGRD